MTCLNMDKRLLKQWDVTHRLLQSAALEITSVAHRQEYVDFISHNELGLALDVLEDAASNQEVSLEFWWNMKKAA